MSRSAILGAKNSGKTTVFRILTGVRNDRPDAAVTGEMKISDQRLLKLSEMFQPKKTTFASISVIDFRNDSGSSFCFTPQELVKCDLLIFVLRAFIDGGVYYPFGESIDPSAEYQELISEIAFKDLEILDRRVEKIRMSLKSAKKVERDALEAEMLFAEKLKKTLEEGGQIRGMNFSESEEQWLWNYNFISLKKRMIVLNRNDETKEEHLKQVIDSLSQAGEKVLVFDGKLELELADLSMEEREDWRKEMGIEYFSSELIQRDAFELLDYISFFTVGEDECRSWPVRKGTAAKPGAGKIHSDLERGFIRAEVIHYSELLNCGSMNEAKKQNLLRLEGGEYLLKDGDIMHIRFNV